eukprot:jgi/Tetstr1/440827/TSEL_029134.t1
MPEGCRQERMLWQPYITGQQVSGNGGVNTQHNTGGPEACQASRYGGLGNRRRNTYGGLYGKRAKKHLISSMTPPSRPRCMVGSGKGWLRQLPGWRLPETAGAVGWRQELPGARTTINRRNVRCTAETWKGH